MTRRSESGSPELFVRLPDEPGGVGRNVWVDTAASPDFVQLRSRLLRFVVPATIGFLSWFFLYIGLNAWAPDLLAVPVFGGVTLVLAIAVGQFATTFAITVLYARYASRRLDPLAEQIRGRLEGDPR